MAKTDMNLVGNTLIPPQAVIRTYQRELGAIVRDMIRSYQPLLKMYAEKSGQMALDADDTSWISTDVEKMLKKLSDYWNDYLNSYSQKLAKEMIMKVLKNGDMQLKSALKNFIAEKRWELIADKIPVAMRQEIKAHVAENVSLIKSVANQYHERIAGSLYRAITGTGSLTRLRNDFVKYGRKASNRAKLIASDQVHKTFQTLAARRMASVGIKKVKWVHGHSAEPRPYHIRFWDGISGKKDGKPNGLNGYIFSIDTPPVIDTKTGERGLPGRLPFCSCRMAPVFEEDE